MDREKEAAAVKMADAIHKMSLDPRGVLSEAREAMKEWHKACETTATPSK